MTTEAKNAERAKWSALEKALRSNMPYKWRVGNYNKTKTKASCLAYIDARDVMDRLDEVCGINRWQDDYKEVGGKLIAGIAILCDDEWVWKWDTGSESDIEKEKGQMSDAFKRAAVKWGIGRFLYTMKSPWVDVVPSGNTCVPVDAQKQRIWDLTEYINNRNTQGMMGIGVIDSVASADEMKKASVSPEQKPKGFSNQACADCGSEVIKNPKTGKFFCASKCWLNKKPEAKSVYPTNMPVNPQF